MSRQPTCDGALSDLILQAARDAMPAVTSGDNDKQAPLLPLLSALIAATTSVAAAVEDNAFDDGVPLPAYLAADLARDAEAISRHLLNAAAARPCVFELPSFSEAAALQLA